MNSRVSVVAILLSGLAWLISHPASAQEAAATSIVITGEEAGSAYGAPPSLSRSRFTPAVTAYVLPPWAVFAGVIYQGDALRYNRPDHIFSQEIELGLPGRFGVAIENSVEGYRGHWQDRSISIEGRWALADWNRIPLNPTLFAEWKFGTGSIFHDEGPPEPLAKGEALDFLREHEPLPDSYELRLLLAEEFFDRFEWAFNFFFEQEVGGDRGREIGFAQSVTTPVILPKERLKLGAEMQMISFTDRGIREDPNESASNRFVIGPTVSWKPTANTRLDVSPLFGATHDAPRASVFVMFSVLFGNGGNEGAEAPTSTRNR